LADAFQADVIATNRATYGKQPQNQHCTQPGPDRNRRCVAARTFARGQSCSFRRDQDRVCMVEGMWQVVAASDGSVQASRTVQAGPRTAGDAVWTGPQRLRARWTHSASQLPSMLIRP